MKGQKVLGCSQIAGKSLSLTDDLLKSVTYISDESVMVQLPEPGYGVVGTAVGETGGDSLAVRVSTEGDVEIDKCGGPAVEAAEQAKEAEGSEKLPQCVWPRPRMANIGSREPDDESWYRTMY